MGGVGQLSSHKEGGTIMTVTNEEAAVIGRGIYNEKICDSLGPECRGKIVVIDVHSGDYEIADKGIDATMSLLARRPDAFIWQERVGFNAVHSMGGSLRRVNDD